MVGVAGRSKGCNTCRARKKGCDLERPACRRCLKAGLVCAGYERNRVFVHFPPPPGESQPAGGAAVALPATDVVLHRSLFRSAREEKYVSMFWDSYVPDRRRFFGTLAKYSYSNCWVPSMQSLQRTDPALNKIMIALSVGTIGLQQQVEWMRQESAKLYVSALQDMNVALCTPSRRKSDAILLATRVFGLYELICGVIDRDASVISAAKSWEGHNLGQLGLIMQRSPEEFTEGIAHSLFVEGRMAMTIMAFVTRKRLALSSTAWKSIPWTTVDKTSKDIIFDVMGDVSGILEDFDRASAIRDEAPRNEEYLQLAEQCWRIDITIVWWSENIGPVDYMNGLFERKFQNQTPDDAAVAYIMLHYWTACMLLYATLRLSLGACLGTEGLLCLPERADPRTYCRNIIYATEVLRHPMAGAFGIHASMFPFSMAAAYLLAVEGRRDEHDKVSPEMTKLLSLFEDGKAGQKWMGLIQTMFRNSVGAPPPPPGKRESAKGSDIRQMIIYARLWYGLDRGHGLETLFEKCLC